jgi:hypothetical protein
MRPEKFRYLMNKAIMHRIETGDNSLFDAQLRRAMKKAWAKHAAQENDYRPLSELQGYSFDADNVEATLRYICDRWRCAYRLRWLIEGLEQEKI